MRESFKRTIEEIFEEQVIIKGNLIKLSTPDIKRNLSNTAEVFTDKWSRFDPESAIKDYEKVQKKWYLDLYGFRDENELGSFLRSRKIIFDAGCGLGYKAAWFAKLSPDSLIIAMDISDSVFQAAEYYHDMGNLFFINGDIAASGLKKASIDYINCDQVIHHTEIPEKTFAHLTSLLAAHGEFACYVYAKKALPRELLDEYFRNNSKNFSGEQLWETAEKLTQLGKSLSELNISVEVPDIPLLGIKAGKYDIQRFIYWNFIKCYWNSDISFESNVSTNFDWYAPALAKRFDENEFRMLTETNNLEIVHWHSEEACYSGRFRQKMI